VALRAAAGGDCRCSVAAWEIYQVRWREAGHSPQVCLGTYAHLFDTVAERIDPEEAVRAARYGEEAAAKRAAG
jgi:hypothetical protein